MQRQVPIYSLAAIVALAVAATVAPAVASDSCRDEAKITYKDCNAAAKENYQSAKDACLNRDHQCVEACRAERYDCHQASGLDAAIAQINADLAAGEDTCRANHPAGSEERDSCIDNEQVLAFQRRGQARENAKPALKQCRVDFVMCAQECPPGAGPSADPVQCKNDAKTTYKTDLAQCRENFQIDKDACRHKDHQCVEQCRADRETCRQPVENQLASDVAACNNTKQGAVDDCQAHYGVNGSNPDPDLLDQCIDNAQTDAFVCRDNAQEAARPGFENCETGPTGFQQCVQACPAA